MIISVKVMSIFVLLYPWATSSLDIFFQFSTLQLYNSKVIQNREHWYNENCRQIHQLSNGDIYIKIRSILKKVTNMYVKVIE